MVTIIHRVYTIALGAFILVLLVGLHPTHVVAQNIVELRRAAERGDVRAQYTLGVLYAYGYDVPQNELEAAKWFRTAAAQGHAVAQLAYELMYVEADPIPMAMQSATIESKIEGAFQGWQGDTIVKLVNGQVWQQEEYWYHYHYAYMPKVIIAGTSGGYTMHVDGVPKSIRVTRLR